MRYRDEHGVPRRTTVSGKTAREARDKAEEVRRRLRAHLPARDNKITLGAFTEIWITSTLAASDRKPSTRACMPLARKHIIAAKLGASAARRGSSRPTSKRGRSNYKAGGYPTPPSARHSTRSRRSSTRPYATRHWPATSRPLSLGPGGAAELAHLTPEVRRVLGLPRQADTPLFALLVNTGLRRGEALALRWSDVDLDAGVLRVRGTLARVDGALVVTEPKTAKSRRSVRFLLHGPAGASRGTHVAG